MGLGLYIGAEVGGKGEMMLKEIERIAPELVDDPVLRRLTETSRDDDGRLWVQLHPAEESVELWVAEGGILMCSAKTSSAGPGYHVWLVEMVQDLGRRVGIEWIWDDEGREFMDETGYASHRDFPRVQQEMLAWLGGLSESLLRDDKEGMSDLLISMPLNCGFTTESFAASPMGEWSREWFEEYVDGDRATRRAKAEEYFPWWPQGMDGVFWRNTGIVLANLELPWHVPANDRERALFETAAACFRRAGELDPSVELPRYEIKEIDELLRTDSRSKPPSKKGTTGYRRREMRLPITGYWRIRLPGYFYNDLEDDGRTAVYWFADRTVRGSSITMKGNTDPAKLLPDKAEAEQQGLKTFELDREGYAGWASVGRTEEDGEEYWTLHGNTAVPNNLCMVTICYDDPADEEWAVEAWKSVSHPRDD